MDERAATGGRLYVVATPIGNLGDVTIRALEVLRSVPLVAAEDTRLTRRLFARHGLATRLVSFHARNASARLPALLEHLRGGADLAVVTDAGTPSVSDPGEELVAAWVADGGRVVPVPGPSAVLAAVVGSAIAGPRWSFEGFLPRSGRERTARLGRIAEDPRGTVVFEAPGRVARTLADLSASCGEGRVAAVCRELTKLHEEFVRGPLGELAAAAAEGRLTLRGEFAIVVGAADARRDGRALPARSRPGGPLGYREEPPTRTDADPDEALAEVDRLVAAGYRRGEAVRLVADATGVPRRRLYRVPPSNGTE
jgi:16S rRNA (cytidine1402-2'-O)-methyltransferase